MGRFDVIVEAQNVESDAVPVRRLSYEEEYLTNLLARVIAAPCQRQLFYNEKIPTCLETWKALSGWFLGGKDYGANMCVVCFIKTEIDKVANPKEI